MQIGRSHVPTEGGPINFDSTGQAIYLFDRYREATSYSLWSRIAALVEWVAENWRQPDDGVWEVEGRDDSGHKVEMKVDARSGEIVKMRRND